MNSIEALQDILDYGDSPDFLNYKIDGYWLDEQLDALYPGNMYKGLVPTLLDWMERKEEEAIVWKRILPKVNETSICPILMCPDDNDFSCTIIVAEITNYGDKVQWKRLGIDKTNEGDAEKVGSVVHWFDEPSELNFSKKDYVAMLEAFRQDMAASTTAIPPTENPNKI